MTTTLTVVIPAKAGTQEHHRYQTVCSKRSWAPTVVSQTRLRHDVGVTK